MSRSTKESIPWPLAAVLFLALALGCEPGSEAGPFVEVRDSAGITIVDNTGEVGPAGGGWAVDPDPVLSIGTFQGDSLYQLFRVQGATRLDDGRVAVVNAGSGEIRLFDAEGRFLTAHGGKGEGPGEFQSPALAGRLGGDTLVVVDDQLRRISLVHAEEGFLGSSPVEEEVGGSIYPQGLFGDRTIVVGGGFYWSGDSGEELADGYTRRATSYRSAMLTGSLATDFGSFPGSEFFMQVRRTGDGIFMSANLIPFGKYGMAAVSREYLYFGSGDSWEIQAFGPAGGLERLIRWDRSPEPVTGELVEAYIQEAEAEATDQASAREARQSLEEMPLPDLRPAFAGLHTDRRSFLWVERSRAPGDESPVFDILDPMGALVGWVALPPVDELLEIGDDYILGLSRDELDVEYLRLLALQRPVR